MKIKAVYYRLCRLPVENKCILASIDTRCFRALIIQGIQVDFLMLSHALTSGYNCESLGLQSLVNIQRDILVACKKKNIAHCQWPKKKIYLKKVSLIWDMVEWMTLDHSRWPMTSSWEIIKSIQIFPLFQSFFFNFFLYMGYDTSQRFASIRQCFLLLNFKLKINKNAPFFG